VLVLTGCDDPTADAVVAELDRRTAVVRMDPGDFPARLRIAAMTVGIRWEGRLVTGAATVDLAEVHSVYYRRPTRFSLPDGLSDGDAVFAAAEARLGLGGVLAALDASWINDPVRVAIAEYKPVQLRVAASRGLRVPRTLVTNDPAAAVQFAADVDGPIVCKPLSSLVLSEDGEARITYTTRVDAEGIDPAELAATAHLLQEWVPKAFEVRVTMVGRRPFAVAIHTDSQAARVDWRADYDALTYLPIDTPTEMAAGMVRYLDRFGLRYGAFDFVVTPDGHWTFLECNPAGQWLWLEHETGLPIAAAIADALTEETIR